MRDLRLQLDDTDFAKLTETARSLIPTLAPEWTDHNIHDPGIMLGELVAWISEAQIYALGRTRRDERKAFAELIGVPARGASAAGGLLWPAMLNDTPPAWAAGTPLNTETTVTPDYPDAPSFRVRYSMLLSTAELRSVRTRFSDGTTRDWTQTNRLSGATFMPFSDPPSPDDRLILAFVGSFVPHGLGTDNRISIGFELETGAGDTASFGGTTFGDHEPTETPAASRLRVLLEDAEGERTLELVSDTTGGLLHSGVLLLRVERSSPISNGLSTITIQSDGGRLLKAPRVRRIGLNVIPIIQRETVAEERSWFGTGKPDQKYQLQRQTLLQSMGKPGLVVKLIDSNGPQDWPQTNDLGTAGPQERHFALDMDTGVISFGNGINGGIPAENAALQVEYQITAGSRGNLPRGVSWMIQGIAGVFGTNSEPVSGGRDPEALDQLRQRARQLLQHARPLVTTSDLEAAACAIPELGVARAMELRPAKLSSTAPRGMRVLVVLGSHEAGQTANEAPEWLAAVRAQLAARLPLGQNLQVIGPRFLTFRLKARLIAASQVDPAVLKQAAETRLRAELALVGENPWPFGRDLTALTVKGWLRNVDGVSRVTSVQLLRDGVPVSKNTLSLGLSGLPQLILADGDIEIERSTLGFGP